MTSTKQFSAPEEHKLIRALWVLSGLFAIGLSPMPYGYYTVLKIAVCYIVWLFFDKSIELREKSKIWHNTMIGLFILYNPIVPLHLGSKELWTVANIATVIILYSMYRTLLNREIATAQKDSEDDQSGTDTSEQELFADNPELKEKQFHLDNFLQWQELPITLIHGSLDFANDVERTNYLCFMTGAINALSRTIQDEERMSEWYHLQVMVASAKSFPLWPDKALEILEDLNDTSSDLHHNAEKGWETMVAYMESVSGNLTKEDFSKNGINLMNVLHPINQST